MKFQLHLKLNGLCALIVLLGGCTLSGFDSRLSDQLTWDQGISIHPELDIEWLKEHAQEGDPDAQVRLASLCYLGTAVPKDVDLAGRLFEQAAIAGVTKAQYCIACMYLTGEGVTLDRRRALYWLKAANAGTGPYAAYAKEKLQHLVENSEPNKVESHAGDVDSSTK